MGWIVFLIILVLIFVIFGICNANATKKEKRKAEEAERAKREREERFIKKVKDTPLVNEWADEIAKYIVLYIEKYPHEDSEFHFRAYQQDFEFGMNLQRIWLPHTKTFISQDAHYCFLEYNFCENGLPDLARTDNQIELFSFAVAEMAADRVNEKGYSVEAKKLMRVVDKNGYYVEGMDDLIGRVVYTCPKVQGKW